MLIQINYCVLMALISEIYALDIKLSDLESISNNGLRLKFSGQKGNQIANFSPVVAKAFLNSINKLPNIPVKD